MRVIAASAIVFSLLLTGCGENNSAAPDPALQQRIKEGQALFMDKCDRCHPRSGRGDYLKRIPATVLTRRSEIELVKWIEGSDKHREMPNFTELTEEQKLALASYLLSQLPSR